MIRIVALGLLALGFLFSCRVAWWTEKKRRAAERDSVRGWTVAASLQSKLSAMEEEETARLEAIGRPLLREIRQGQAVKARREQERQHRGSQA